MDKFEITLKNRPSLRVAGTLTVHAEGAEQAHDMVAARLRSEKFIETDDGVIHKVENLGDSFGMRRIKPSISDLREALQRTQPRMSAEPPQA